MHLISDFILYIFFLIIFTIIRIIPYAVASNVLGGLFRTLGPIFPVTKVAYKNLDIAFPTMSYEKKQKIVKIMWENVGRMIAEFPHVVSISGGQLKNIMEIRGSDILDKLRKNKKPTMIITAHFGNWEMAARKLRSLDFDISVVYRKMNNKFIDKVICQVREKIGINQIPKSTSALKMLLEDLAQNRMICLLSDQKQNTGIEVDFFGSKVMTGTLPAKMALKKNVSLVPVMVTRKKNKPHQFIMHVGDLVDISQNDSVESITQKINDIQEKWIRKYPEEWFWLHKRWPKENYIDN